MHIFSIHDLIQLYVYDMFRTTKCSASGTLVLAVLWYFIMHPNTQSGRCQNAFDFAFCCL